MKRVLERLMDTDVTVDDDDEEEETKQTNNQQHSSVHCFLGTLCDWYSSQTKVRLQSRASVHDLHVAAPWGGPMTFTKHISLNYRNPALEHQEKSAALRVEIVHSNLRL